MIWSFDVPQPASGRRLSIEYRITQKKNSKKWEVEWGAPHFTAYGFLAKWENSKYRS